MAFTFARYRRKFTLDDTPCEAVISADFAGMHSELFVDGDRQASDFTPAMGADATRNHHLEGTLPDGSAFSVEAGYISWVNVGIRVLRDGDIVHESHPGRTIAYPKSAVKMASDPGADMSRYRANRVPIMVDVALGLVFFVLAKLTDLQTAAIAGAVIGLALLALQRFVKEDLLGGLALFGVFLLLVSAGLAIAFDSDMAIKQRGTIVGTISALLFLGDGLLGGNRLGKGMARYLPYNDIDPARLAVGMGVLGIVSATVNYLVARFASTNIWLFYTTFADFLLIALLMIAVLRFARHRPITGNPNLG